TAWERLRHFTRFPKGRPFQGVDRASGVVVQDLVELLCDPRLQVMAVELRFGMVDHSDGTFEHRPCYRRIAFGCGFRLQEEVRNAHRFEERFPTCGQWPAHALAFGLAMPCRGGGNRSRARGKADEPAIRSAVLPHELADVD